MAIAKKGLRTIEVNGKSFVYKISKLKKKSDWREDKGELNEDFLKYARYYGLGEVKDASLNIVIQLKEEAGSRILVKFHTLLVAGFLGPEQMLQITPKLVKRCIEIAYENGWNPKDKPDYYLELAQQLKDKKPVLLKLPTFPEPPTDYKNIDEPTPIFIHENEK